LLTPLPVSFAVVVLLFPSAVVLFTGALRHAGHAVFIRQSPQGAKPISGYRISVDGQTMTVWELWAQFRSELGDDEPTPPSVAQKKR
jgi:hypothetical protein